MVRYAVNRSTCFRNCCCFSDINILQGSSVATRTRSCGVTFYKSAGERILKMDQYLAKLRAKIYWHLFPDTEFVGLCHSLISFDDDGMYYRFQYKL